MNYPERLNYQAFRGFFCGKQKIYLFEFAVYFYIQSHFLEIVCICIYGIFESIAVLTDIEDIEILFFANIIAFQDISFESRIYVLKTLLFINGLRDIGSISQRRI